MYVCLCKGITDSQIRAAVDQGADSITELQKKIDIAQSCGSCIEMTESILKQESKERAEPAIYIPSVA